MIENKNEAITDVSKFFTVFTFPNEKNIPAYEITVYRMSGTNFFVYTEYGLVT